MNLLGLLVVVAALGAVMVGVVAVLTSLGPVSRERVETFVVRTGVVLTHGNAGFVVDSLARTKRWRTAMVLVTVSGCIAWDIVHGSATFTTAMGVLLAFAFLVGSLVAEVRSASARAPRPRTASLVARVPAAYVGDWARRWPAALAVAAILLGGVAALVPPREPVAALVVAGIAVSAWALGRWASRFVLERPRPGETAGGVIEADEGLRSRALHAVGGAVVLAGSWAVLALVGALLVPRPEPPGVSLVAVLVWLGMVVAARVAWVRATAPFPIGVDASGTSASGSRP